MKRINKYNKTVYDRIGITIKKSDKYNKDYIKAYCSAAGISVNAFIVSSIRNALDNTDTGINETDI